MKKYLAALLFFFVAILIIALPSCLQQKKHSNLPKDFNALSRIEQVNWCASCHKEIFENEAKGPHSNAYKELVKHSDFVNSDKYQCSFYTQQVNRKFENNCIRCHAVENLFENVFVNHFDSSELLTTRLLDMDNPLPQARGNKKSYITGIDCISCHFDGKGVVSATKNISDTIQCNPRYSVFASSNMTCYPCHFQELKSLQPATSSCKSCHQEYKKGKGTHYYYWKHDPIDKPNPLLERIVNDVSINVTDNDKASVVWRNSSIPHVLGMCAEIIIKCEVLDMDSQPLGQTVIRLNRKKLFDQVNYKELGNNNLYGEYGDTIPAINSVNKYSMALRKGTSASANMIRLSLIQKPQYWFPDSLGNTTFVKSKKL